MRKFLTAVALATVFASPALAQSYTPEVGSGNVVAGVTSGFSGAAALQARLPAASAYARVDRSLTAPAALSDEYVVRDGAKVYGQDPDPFIRSQLRRLRGMGYPG
jgi:hypothetical protein